MLIDDDPEPALIRAGDPKAFDALHQRYAPRVLGYLLRMGCPRADAEDLTQETFLAAYAGRRTFAGRSRSLAWLLGIAVRRRRDRGRTPRPTEALPEAAVAPGDLIRTTEATVAVEAALCSLEPALREVVILVLVQGLTHREAAAALDEPVGTVKWRVFEATKRLRARLAAAEEEARAI